MNQTKKFALLAFLLLTPLLVYWAQQGPSPQAPAQAPATSSKLVSNLAVATDNNFENEFVIFFSGNMTNTAALELFFSTHPQVRFLAHGSFPGVVVVGIDPQDQTLLEDLKQKDYVDLIIKNQPGLDCH